MRARSEVDPNRRAEQTVLAFNDATTRRDVAALGRLMTDDHTFIDSDENVFSGKEEVLGVWRGFFEAFPDYRNVWAELLPSGDAVIALGHSVCATEPASSRVRCSSNRPVSHSRSSTGVTFLGHDAS
jgi:ketosteroid isomerase-like protein